MKTIAIAIVLVLMSSGAIAQDGQRLASLCISPDAPKQGINPKTKVATVLCCCNTSNGMCCKNQTFCGGIVMGCFCN